MADTESYYALANPYQLLNILKIDILYFNYQKFDKVSKPIKLCMKSKYNALVFFD